MFNIGIIGAGRIANIVAKQLVATKRFNIVAVYSRTFRKSLVFADKYDCIAYSNFDNFLRNKDIDAIYIATPHSSHYEYLKKCINAHKPVLCEKAFTVNSNQAKFVIDLAKQKDVFVCEAMWTKFNPVVQKINNWVKDGLIGNIKKVKASFCLPLQVAKPYVSERVYKPEYAGGALLDLGVYPIAYSYFLLGKPDDINAQMKIVKNIDINDKITLNYNSGAKAILNCSLNSFKSYLGVIKGDKGVIVSPMFYKPKFAILLSNKGIKFAFCKRSYIYEFDQLELDLKNKLKESSIMSHNDTLNIMEIMDTCRKQNNFYYKDIETT